MALEDQVSALVSAANNLTGVVSGKVAEIDGKVAEAVEKVDSSLDSLKTLLPRIAITRNQVLAVDGATGLPVDFGLHSQITAELYMSISAAPSLRTSEQVALLQDMELDMGVGLNKTANYREGFNVFKLSWSEGTSYLAFPQAADSDDAAVATNTFFTVGAFVKVLAGSLDNNAWANGSELGKWKFCSKKYSPSGFGRYTHLHPYRATESGEVLVALPAAITGHIDSAVNWFSNIKL